MGCCCMQLHKASRSRESQWGKSECVRQERQIFVKGPVHTEVTRVKPHWG